VNLIPLKDAADILGVTTSAVKKWRDEGFAHLRKIGGRLFLTSGEIRRLQSELDTERRGLTTANLAPELHCTVRTVQNLCKRSRWAVLTRKGYRVLPEHLENFESEISKEA